MQQGLPRAYEHNGDWSCNGGDPYGASGYRLPTDAEWEYAAQYDDERIYPWGNEAPECSRANYTNWAPGPVHCVGWTSPVGSYPGVPSINGESLYDMAGNAWEWCNDWHVCDLGTSSETDPTGPGTGSYRVLRGGAWGHHHRYMRCASRIYYDPSYPLSFTGFRCVRSQQGQGTLP
jgi:formylglycine-generating enzyme required for sulfatase activity